MGVSCAAVNISDQGGYKDRALIKYWTAVFELQISDIRLSSDR